MEKTKTTTTTTNTNRVGTAWTREEIRTLRSIFRNQSNVAVAAVLDRTPKSVERKASRLNLTKTKKYLRSIGRTV